MKLSISEITTLPSSLEDDVAAFSAAGFTAVELSLEKVGRYLATHSIEEMKRLLEQSGLTPNGAIGLAPSGPALLLSRGESFETYVEALREQLALCRTLGIKQIGIGADSAKWITEDDWMPGAIRNLRVAAAMAAEADMRIGLEFMSLDEPIGPFVLSSLEEARRIVDRVGSDSIGINIDYFHHYRSGGTVTELAAVPGTEIVDVHVTDVNGMPRHELGDGDRVLPGDGVLPLDAYRDAIMSTGYNGYWVLELLNEALWQKPPAEAARLGMASLTVHMTGTERPL